MSDNNIDSELNSLVNQLKDNNVVSNNLDRAPENSPLTKDDVEDFVVENAGKLISQSLEVMENMKDHIMASNDPESISALADLIKASSSSIDTLNKMVIQNKRSATTIATKQMDIDSRHAIEDKRNENAFIGSREEVFKKILDEAKVIEIKEEDTLDNNTNSGQ